MTVNPRSRQQIVLDLFQIGVTDAAGLDADQHFAGTDLRRRNTFDVDGLLTQIHGGLHRCRHGSLGRGYQLRNCSFQ